MLAILCDFKGRPAREVIHFILERLKHLTADNDGRFREYLRMLEILSTNRDLEKVIEEEEKMLSQIEYNQLPSYNIGHQEGRQEGRREEARNMLHRLITRRFGPMSAATHAHLENATIEQLEQWADNVLDASGVEDLFKE